MLDRTIIIFCSICVLALAGCNGGGGDKDAGSSVTEVRAYYANGQLKAHGYVATGTQTKTGDWDFYFENGQMRWSGSYVNNEIDGSKHWREWNSDGSVRDDQQDGL